MTMTMTNENENLTICAVCGNPIADDERVRFVVIDGYEEEIHADCYRQLERDYYQCENCGEWFSDYLTTVGTQEWCDDCVQHNAVECWDCGEIIPQDEAIEDDGVYYCESCYENHKGSDKIRSYGKTHAEQFYLVDGQNEKTSLFMGVELEIDREEENPRAERDLCDFIDNLENNRFFDLKHDGSLDHGFEIATQPASLRYHKEKSNWDLLQKKAIENGYQSHDIGTCGLHVHVSRAYFDDDMTSILKLWTIFYNNKTWIETFARRESCSWCKSKDAEAIGYLVSRGYECDRYLTINIMNSQTIEFRLFRGTLKHSTFIATLELVQFLCDFVKDKQFAECQSLNLRYTDFGNFEYLKAYVNEKGL